MSCNPNAKTAIVVSGTDVDTYWNQSQASGDGGAFTWHKPSDKTNAGCERDFTFTAYVYTDTNNNGKFDAGDGSPFNRRNRVMKTHCKLILLFTLSMILHGGRLMMCEEPDEVPFEDSSPTLYHDDDSNGIRFYMGLPAHGDYTKLKLIVRSEKMNYYPGEPVWIKFYVRNDSDSDVHIQRCGSSINRIDLWKLFHSNYDEPLKTSKGEKRSQLGKQQVGRETSIWGIESGFHYFKLRSGQEYQQDWYLLTDYYDLSKPDTYELTCFLTTFLQGQYYEPPLQSNTLTFRILEPTGEEPPLPRSEPQHIPYTNPPPGEEVFKQPKPPKNVFYVRTNDEPEIVFLDASPTTYYRQKAKEAEAAKTEPERPVK